MKEILFNCEVTFEQNNLSRQTNELWARGEKGHFFRNPKNVYEFINRNRRVKSITLVYRENPLYPKF